MKKILIITLLLLGCLSASNSMAQLQGIFINMMTKGYSSVLVINSDSSFVYGFAGGVNNSGKWKIKDKNKLILTFNRQTVFISGDLDGLVSAAKIINKNTMEYNGRKFRRHPKHPTLRQKEAFEACEYIIKHYERKNNNM